VNSLRQINMKDKQEPFSELNARELMSFVQARQAIEHFEKVLKSHQIEVASGSDLEIVCLNIMDMEDRRIDKGRTYVGDIRPLICRSLGLLELVKLLIHAHKDSCVEPFISHLKLLNRSVAAQNVRVVSDEGANKLFELFFGLVCQRVGTDLSLDDPNEPTGDNPDILVTIDRRRWGFACKVVNGKSLLTVFERWEEGVRQIDRSSADVGAVVLNLRNVIDHNKIWPLTNQAEFDANLQEPLFGAWQDTGPVVSYLQNLSTELGVNFVMENGKEAIRRVIAETKTLPAVLLFLQTVTGIQISKEPVPTTISLLGLVPFGDIDGEDHAVLERINIALHPTTPQPHCELPGHPI